LHDLILHEEKHKLSCLPIGLLDSMSGHLFAITPFPEHMASKTGHQVDKSRTFH